LVITTRAALGSTGRTVDNTSDLRHHKKIPLTTYGVVLPGASLELRAAYKLYAFCRQHDLDHFPHRVLHAAFEKFGSALYEWWSGNAKYVLPPINFYSSLRGGDERSAVRAWRDVVSEAANAWRSMAQSWSILRIPDFMDHRSPEYAQYQQYVDALNETREREEYKRLKRKFEGKGNN
jgi:hypothetical protein